VLSPEDYSTVYLKPGDPLTFRVAIPADVEVKKVTLFLCGKTYTMKYAGTWGNGMIIYEASILLPPVEGGEEAGEKPEAEREETKAQPTPILEKTEAPVEAEPIPEGARVYFKVIISPASELQGSTVPLNFDVFGKITIGRSEENVIITPDPSVSRKHAVVYLDEQRRLVIEDLGSTNGTFIYNKDTGTFVKVEKAYLKSGDIIRLGEGTVFQVVVES
jgi:hypothetical protein